MKKWMFIFVVGACGHKSRAPDAIPHTTVAIKIDGEWDEPDWSKVALRRQFEGDDHQLARPSSEMRLLHDDTTLYVGLYAGDEDIQSTDAFEFVVGPTALRIDATGKVTPSSPEIHAAVDRDGTLDDPANNDEEWVNELAIPLAQTGLSADQHTNVRSLRCDRTKDGVKRCGSWAGSLTLE